MINTAFLTGNIGKDMSVESPNGKTSYLRFPVGVSVKKGEDYNTTWVNCVMFGDFAERISYVEKGDSVLISGKISLDKGNDGNNYLNMVVFSLEFLRKRDDSRPSKSVGNPLDDDIPF